VTARNFTAASWDGSVTPYLSAFLSASEVARVAKAFRERCYKDNKVASADDDDCDDEGVDLCNCEFSLAYGGMILLNNARLRLKRGHRYGLCGPNGAGKSTLMRAIANGVGGLPNQGGAQDRVRGAQLAGV
jgi:elongation factor 3